MLAQIVTSVWNVLLPWCQLKGLVTRIMHAKYQCSITNTLEDMSQVKVFVTDRGTNEF